MRTRADYERMLAAVREVIHEWDPYCLLEMGAPSDEFDMEIGKIVAAARHFASAEDAAQAVSHVFAKSFGPETFEPEDCAEVGAAVYAALLREGLLWKAPDHD